MNRKLAVLALIAVVLTGCIGTRVQESYEVSGQVVIYGSEEPLESLPGVSITSTLGEVIATTDEEGYFTLSGLKGRVTITPALDGWEFLEKSITVTGPQDDLMFFAYDSSETSSGSVKISFIGDYDSIRPQMNTRDHIPFTPEIYRAEFQEPGNLVKSVTPHKFITGLSDIGVAHPNYTMPLLLTSMRMGHHSGFGMPIYFDLAMSNDIIDASYLIQANRFDFEAVELTVFTKNGSYYSGGYNIPTVSEIHVDLGEDYRNVDFPHALRKYDTTHVFQFADLIPLEGVDDTILAYIVFGSYVDEPFILNPDGAFLEDINRHPWYKDGGTYLGGYGIYLPGFDITFEDGVENHLIFSWNLDGLIEVYDNNSSDPSEHLITFRLDNPFPVEMYVEQGVAFDPPEADESVIEEVSNLDISYYELLNHEIVLRWLNPSNIEYETTHIVRKVGSAPSDVSDGDVVYSGKTPLFKDSDLEPDQHYYYRVFTQNRAGVFSEGKVADIVSSGPELERIEIHTDSDPIVLTVGERVHFAVSGYDSKRGHTIVVDWELDESLGTLSQVRGEGTLFTASEVGETILRAKHHTGLQDEVVIRVVSERGSVLIVDSESKSPIKGAAASIDGTSVDISDVEGVIQLGWLPDGTHELRIDAESYLSKLEPIAMEDGFFDTIELEEYVEKTTQVVEQFTTPEGVLGLVLDEDEYVLDSFVDGKLNYTYNLDWLLGLLGTGQAEILSELRHKYTSKLDNGTEDVVEVSFRIVFFADTWEETHRMIHRLVQREGKWKVHSTRAELISSEYH